MRVSRRQKYGCRPPFYRPKSKGDQVGANTSTAGGPTGMVFSRLLLEHKCQSWVNFRSPRTRNGQISIVSNIMINRHSAKRSPPIIIGAWLGS
jgi:hypothetical protein